MSLNQNESKTALSNELVERDELVEQLLDEQLMALINKPAGKKYSKLDVLELEKPYNIVGWISVNVKNRKSVVLDLKDFRVWAPDWFAKLSNENLDRLVQRKFKFVYSGKKKLNNGFTQHDFKIIK